MAKIIKTAIDEILELQKSNYSELGEPKRKYLRDNDKKTVNFSVNEYAEKFSEAESVEEIENIFSNFKKDTKMYRKNKKRNEKIDKHEVIIKEIKNYLIDIFPKNQIFAIKNVIPLIEKEFAELIKFKRYGLWTTDAPIGALECALNELEQEGKAIITALRFTENKRCYWGHYSSRFHKAFKLI